jgi:hypothetical protein
MKFVFSTGPGQGPEKSKPICKATWHHLSIKPLHLPGVVRVVFDIRI